MDFDVLQVHGVGGAILVAGIVKALTVAGMPTKYAPLASLISGFGVATLVVAEQYYPAVIGPILNVLIGGLTLGLGASGAYSWLTAGKTSAPIAQEQAGEWVATYKPTTPGMPPAVVGKPAVDAGPHEL